ncbi:endonuclease/exonuclease/phosphatase family protein [Actinomadura macrotermitis]|uniref:Endonuclease/exonuclease/phosphatase domain-containing protein n=1 Tax=Actinomadura macrotermitis TaxID=2585200 RepID=A0A7K0BVP4_9ACTN|nr:hypothetical protein [Actinomadura macrotermitis]
MRAPRALIPLLAVCGAGAVVAFAGAGAAIEKGSASGLSDEAAPEPVQATITTMTWSACGDTAPGCPLGARPADLARRIVQESGGNLVGGRRVRADAVFLQEVCAGHVGALEKTAALRGWSWAFAPYGPARKCANGQGRSGVAIGTRAKLADVRREALPAPAGQGRSVLCGTVEQWQTRLCTARFSGAEDPRGEWRRKQARRLGELAGSGRVIFGGDLVDEPAGKPLDALYGAYDECDQGPEARAGAKTRQDWSGQAVAKTDYLFTTRSAGVSCGVSPDPNRASDHRPLTAVVRFG